MPISAQVGGRCAPRLRISSEFWRAMLAVTDGQSKSQVEAQRVLAAALADGYSIAELEPTDRH